MSLSSVLFPVTRRKLEFSARMLVPTTTHQRKQIITLRPRGRAPINSIGNTPELNVAIEDWDRALRPHVPREMLRGALRLSVLFEWPWRESEAGKDRLPGGIWRTTKPDLSNLIKTFEDRLTALGFIEDDARICSYGRMEKRWGESPGFRVRIEEIGEEDFEPWT